MLETINGKSSTPFFQTASGISLPVPTGLPPTGQTTKYVDGDDGDIQAGYAPAERLTDNGDGTITDNATGLMWVKDMQLGTPKGWWKTGTVYAVGDIVCNPTNTGAVFIIVPLTGWNAESDYLQGYHAAWMDVDGPDNSDEEWTGLARYFWLAKANNGPSYGGAVNPSTDDGSTWELVKAWRCIEAHVAGTGLNAYGGPKWARVKHIGAMLSDDVPYDGLEERPVSWALAIQFCNEFEWAGYSDWRLPNVNEAMSICDWKVEAGGYGAIFSEFTNQASIIADGATWTSTRKDNDAQNVYRTIDPRPYPRALTNLYYLRPCRGGRING